MSPEAAQQQPMPDGPFIGQCVLANLCVDTVTAALGRCYVVMTSGAKECDNVLSRPPTRPGIVAESTDCALKVRHPGVFDALVNTLKNQAQAGIHNTRQ